MQQLHAVNDLLPSSVGGGSDFWGCLGPTALRRRTIVPSISFRVLVVDDELWGALDMEWVVRKLGHQVVGSAATADEAIRLAETEIPDLVLMDIRLGNESDGIVAATVIRQRFEIPSLFVTAHGDLAMRQRAEAAQPAAFIEKPFAPETLARAIGEALCAKAK